MRKSSQKILKRESRDNGLAMSVDMNSLPAGNLLKKKNFGSCSKGARIDDYLSRSSGGEEIIYSYGSIGGISL